MVDLFRRVLDFYLLASIAGTLRYDIIRANAIKLVCTFVFTLVSLAIFIWQDQVAWMEGLILSIGYVAGAYFGQVCCVHRSKGTEMVLIRSHTARRWGSDGFLMHLRIVEFVVLAANHKVKHDSNDHCANDVLNGRALLHIVTRLM